MRARDLRIGAEIIQRSGQDNDDDRSCAGAARIRVVVVALSTGDRANDQPDHEHDSEDPHSSLRSFQAVAVSARPAASLAGAPPAPRQRPTATPGSPTTTPLPPPPPPQPPPA